VPLPTVLSKTQLRFVVPIGEEEEEFIKYMNPQNTESESKFPVLEIVTELSSMRHRLSR
jgi:hypothetical protein